MVFENVMFLGLPGGWSLACLGDAPWVAWGRSFACLGDGLLLAWLSVACLTVFCLPGERSFACLGDGPIYADVG